MLKFQTNKGIETIYGDQEQARVCYVQGVDGKAAGKAMSASIQLGDIILQDINKIRSQN